MPALEVAKHLLHELSQRGEGRVDFLSRRTRKDFGLSRRRDLRREIKVRDVLVSSRFHFLACRSIVGEQRRQRRGKLWLWQSRDPMEQRFQCEVWTLECHG